jgi:DNA-binding transcriptional LysR family regulator
MKNLDQLRIFHAAAQSRSFTRAAQAVHLTQPGISKHIRQIEEEIGLPLFDRLGKKVALTQAGEVLFQASQEIMASIATAELRIEELKGMHGGKLVLGASFALGNYVLPGFLAEFRKLYPLVELTLEISLSEKIAARILANELDVGLVSYRSPDQRLSVTKFMTDELIVIVPPGHPWAKKSRVKPQDLMGETFIVPAKGAATRGVIEERLKNLGIVLTNVLDFGNIDGVKRAVEVGLGVAIQSKSMMQREIEAGILVGVRLTGMDAMLDSFYICRKDKHLSTATKAFLTLLQNGSQSVVHEDHPHSSASVQR